MSEPDFAATNATVDVVVVTYNSAAVIGDCLDALADEASSHVGVIVVDNDSSDNTVSIAADHRCHARVIETGRNGGYSAAINAGVEASHAEYIFVLNPDTRIHKGAISVLRDELGPAAANSGAGIAAPLIRNPDGSLEPTLRRFPSTSRLLGQSVLGSSRAGRHVALGDLIVNDDAYTTRGVHDWCSGAAMMITRDCLDAVGPWDESFFLYSEETDFAWRANKLGYQMVFSPDAVVEHIGGDSNSSERLWSILVTNRVRLVRKHRGRLQGAGFWAASVAGEAARAWRPRNRAALKALVTGLDDPDVNAARDRGSDWLIFAGQDWWYHNRAHSDFQLATRVAETRNVLLVNAMAMRMPLPGRSPGAWRRIGRKIMSTTKALRVPVDDLPNYAVLSLVLLPFYGSPFFRKLNGWLVATQVRAALRWRGMKDPVVFTTLPTSVDVIDRLKPTVVAFNRSDKHSAFEETNQDVIRSLEQRLLSEASVVLYVSHHLLDEDAEFVGDRSYFLDHGVDLEHFVPTTEPDELATIAHPRIGFFGGLDDYIVDFEILKDLARDRPDYQIVLVGDATIDLSELDAFDNVHLLGFKPYATIPGFGSGFDVGLMPWVDNEWIASCNPIKMKEYLALGMPIVTTDFPELKPYRHLVHVATPENFTQAVDDALAAGQNDSDRSEALKRRDSVLDASWDRRARQLRDLLEGLK